MNKRSPVRLFLVLMGLSAVTHPSSIAAQGAGMSMMDPPLYTYVAFDELEYLATGVDKAFEFDGEVWIGGDFNRAWFKGAGERATGDDSGSDLEVQALYSRVTSAFWNAQAGLRLDRISTHGASESRGLFALGLQGLAPYWFEVESFVFVSLAGDLSARLEASYETLLTQRLIVESAFEVNAAVQEVTQFGVGSGLNNVELGARARYEFKREFAPYVGYSWNRLLSNTADLVRSADGAVSHGAVVFGLHLWY